MREYFKSLPDESTPLTGERLNGIFNGEESIEKIVVGDIECKNKFNKYGSLTDYIEYSSGTNTLENGKIKATANVINGNGKGQIIQLEPNTVYTYSVKIDSVEAEGLTTFRILDVLHDGTAPNELTLFSETVSAIAGKTYSYQFTTGDTGKIWLTLNGITNNDYTIFKYVIYDNIQIEKSSVATEYTPHKSLGYTSGSNGLGYWVKYDDGRMECWQRFSETLSIKNTFSIFGGTGYYAQLNARPFPQPFTQLDGLVMDIESSNNGYALCLMTSGIAATLTHTCLKLVVSPSLDENDNVIFNYHAIGRWK